MGGLGRSSGRDADSATIADAPGPVVQTRAELVTAIAEAGPSAEKYAAKRALWREKFAPHDDGHAGERVVRRLYEQGWLS